MLQVVWGRAANVWWVPTIELIESRAQYFSAVCPMMFFYGLPGVMPRMIDEAGLDFSCRDDGGDDGLPRRRRGGGAAIHGGPLAGLYRHRLDAAAQGEVRDAMRAHVERSRSRRGGDRLPAEASLTVAARPESMG